MGRTTPLIKNRFKQIRDDAKTFIYAFLGAGIGKLNQSLKQTNGKNAGRKNLFIQAYPGLNYKRNYCPLVMLNEGYLLG